MKEEVDVITNIEQARAERAAQLADEGGLAEEATIPEETADGPEEAAADGPEDVRDAADAGQEDLSRIEYNPDELFTLYGASQFENMKLKQLIQRHTQTIVALRQENRTLKNTVATKDATIRNLAKRK